MKSPLYIFVFFGWLFYPGIFVKAQYSPDTVVLQDAVVSDFYLKHLSSGYKIAPIDSATLLANNTKDLSSLLAQNSTVYIKNYGPNQLASTSFRGGSASHTAVVWNGFNLSSSMNGMIDLSLIPTGLMDQVEVQYGASTSLWGSGAVGGSILLNNQAYFSSGWQVSYGNDFGSFGRQSHFGSVKFGNKKLYTSVKLYTTHAENDFEYAEEFTLKSGRTKQEHSQQKAHGILAEAHWLIKPKHKLNLNYWYQYSDRNLPPTLAETESTAWQKDINNKLALHYQYFGRKHSVQFRSAWLSDDFLYYNNGLGNEDGLADSWITEATWNLKINPKQELTLGVNHTENWVNSDDYNNFDQQIRNALFAAFQQKFTAKWTASINARQEWVDAEMVPFTFSVGSDYQVLKKIKLMGNFSKLYRTPNLNDLYWAQGGSTDLKSENGYAIELGTELEIVKNKKWEASVGVNLFYRKVNNWIVWTPGQPYWTPQNLLEVTSKGIETQWNLLRTWKNWKLGFDFNTAYIHSYNTKASVNNENSLGKQLIYVPLYTGNAGVQLYYKKWSLRYNHSYTGYTYTLADHSQYLEPYQVANVQLSYVYRLKTLEIYTRLGIDNLWNEAYSVVQNRPMPLQQFHFSIQFHFKQKLKTS